VQIVNKGCKKTIPTYYRHDLSSIDRPEGAFEKSKVGHDGEDGDYRGSGQPGQTDMGGNPRSLFICKIMKNQRRWQEALL